MIPPEASSATPTAAPPNPGLPGAALPAKKLFILIVVAFMVHLGLICFFGTKSQIVPRRVSHVPRLQLADGENTMIALEDPTLFALPNRRDFSSSSWSRIPLVSEPSFQWNESPRWLALDTNSPATAFTDFAPMPAPLEMAQEVKPPPVVTGTPAQLGGAMPVNSSLNILGGLSGRDLLKPVDLPSLPFDNVIPSSRVQVLVDPSGQIISAVLLPPIDSTEEMDRCDAADQQALVIARRLRFTPSSHVNVGEIDFSWQAVPPPSKHSPTQL